MISGKHTHYPPEAAAAPQTREPHQPPRRPPPHGMLTDPLPGTTAPRTTVPPEPPPADAVGAPSTARAAGHRHTDWAPGNPRRAHMTGGAPSRASGRGNGPGPRGGRFGAVTHKKRAGATQGPEEAPHAALKQKGRWAASHHPREPSAPDPFPEGNTRTTSSKHCNYTRNRSSHLSTRPRPAQML